MNEYIADLKRQLNITQARIKKIPDISGPNAGISVLALSSYNHHLTLTKIQAVLVSTMLDLDPDFFDDSEELKCYVCLVEIKESEALVCGNPNCEGTICSSCEADTGYCPTCKAEQAKAAGDINDHL